VPNLDKYIDKLKTTNDILKKATKGIEIVRNAAISLEDNIKGKYEEVKPEKVFRENVISENWEEKDIQIEKAAEKTSEDDIINVDFNETSLAQAFIYSEIFGKPKSLRRGR
jgi:hypothetical protein